MIMIKLTLHHFIHPFFLFSPLILIFVCSLSNKIKFNEDKSNNRIFQRHIHH